ncbi:MAG: 6-phosphofructokinase [Chloroflexota bacterium]
MAYSNWVKGKLVVAQSGGATAVINNTVAGIIEAGGKAFDDVWGARDGAEGLLAEDYVDLGDLVADDVQLLAGTPGAALRSSRRKLTDDELEVVLESFQQHEICALLFIGGNDSADTAHRLALLAARRHCDIAVIGVPKTIDNDLPETDHCPGYGSIARYLAIATMDSAKDTESMPRMYPVKFIEVMGRDAGWVAASSALGRAEAHDAPHLIYLPERPVSPGDLLADVSAVYERLGHVVAVVSETVRDPSGRPFAEADAELDEFGHPLLRGTAASMCRLVQGQLGLRSRWDKPGSLQRMAMLCVSSVDLAEARTVGDAAVELAVSGETDRMVTLVRESDEPYHCSAGSVGLERIANRQRLIPDEFLSQSGRDVSDRFIRYARPLLGPEPLPRYFRLRAR